MGKSRKRAVHLSASRAGDVLRKGLCGFFDVDLESDISLVTCRECLKRHAKGQDAPKGTRADSKGLADAGELARAVAEAGAQPSDLRPCAPAPPIVSAPLWAASCKGAEHRRCGSCELCEWERL